MSWVTELARPEILALKPYEHATWEPDLERLHANELPWRSCADDSLAGLNRYPEPQPRELVERLASLYDVSPGQLLVGRGSDEAIDLLIRGFCRSGWDSIVICPPTFGMYAVAARIQGAQVITVPLLSEPAFALDESAILEACTPDVKLVFLCSPNNPTGNRVDEAAVLRLTQALHGRAAVVIDEAYIEFAAARSLAHHIDELPHLIILRTLSKAYALAGARCGVLIGDPEVVQLLNKVIPPYAIAQLSLEAVLKALQPPQLTVCAARINTILSERTRLSQALTCLANVARVYRSDANFLLVEFKDAALALARTRGARLLIRDVRHYPRLSGCLRITVGSPEQNQRLLESLA